jgi:hypothetical protein
MTSFYPETPSLVTQNPLVKVDNPLPGGLAEKLVTTGLRSLSSPLALEPLTASSLYLDQQVLPLAKQALQQFAIADNFDSQIQIAFGEGCNVSAAQDLVENLATGEFPFNIQTLPQSQLQGDGAFGNDTLFISEDLLNSHHLDRSVDVILEEMGHFVDSQINSLDAPGDEGEIFANLVQQHSLSEMQLVSLKAEDDHGFLSFNNELIAVEKALPPVGVFQVDSTGKLQIDFLADSGAYRSEMAVFSLEGMDSLQRGSAEFIKEAARRALTSSVLGYTVIIDPQEGAKFSGELGEKNLNEGSYKGAKIFSFNPSDQVAMMLVPQGTIQEIFNSPPGVNDKLPLFSLAAANPQSVNQLGQLVPGTFGWEDIRADQNTDADYNDIVFQVKGALGNLPDLGTLIASGRDWRGLKLAQEITQFASQSVPNLQVNLASDTGQSNSDLITNNPEIVGSITNQAGNIEQLQASLNGGNFVNLVAQYQADASFRLTQTTLAEINGGNLADGSYQLTLKAKDQFGNNSKDVSFSFTLDTSAPQTPGFILNTLFDSAPIGDSHTTYNQINLLGQTEANALLTLTGLGLTTTADSIGKFSFSDIALALGTNNLTVSSQDLAGNSSTFTATIQRDGTDNSDVVLDWNATLLNAVYEDKTAPPLASRNMAMVQAAVFDTVNSFNNTYKNYHFVGSAPVNASIEAAAASAAYRVLVNLYPKQKTFLDNALTASLAEIPDGTVEDTGVAFGQTVADDILTLRNNDGSANTVIYTPGINHGEWQPTPPAFNPALLPQWGEITPFALTSGSQFRPDGPPALDSAVYTTDFNQVKELGSLNSTTRTAEQTEIAKFWADGTGTFTPPGHWNQIAQNVAVQKGNSLLDNARLFALLDISLADAGIAAWEAKYNYNFWRPITAIQQAETDGNASTIADASWQPLLTTPAFPEYVSGHSTFSGAAETILTSLLGDNVGFSVNSLGLPGVERQFTSFTAAAEEAGMSRIYGGIHFNSANVDGLATGRNIGNYVLQNLLTFSSTDVQAPVIQASLSNDTGSSNTDKITNNPAISGTVTDENAIAVFRAKLDSGAFVDVSGTLQNGTFSLDSAKLKEINGNTDLGQGGHTLGLEATDSKGNVSAVLNYSFTLDSVSPIAAITSNLSNEPTSLDVTVSEVVSGEFLAQGSYSLKVVGGANDGQSVVINSLTKVSDTVVLLSLATPLTAGNYQLAIAPEVKDTAGNSLANQTLDFTATPPTDVQAPVVQASLMNDTGSSNTDKITNNPAISGTVTDENAIAVFRAKLDSGAFVDVSGTLQNGAFSLDSAKLKEINGNTDLAQGEHTLGLEATDSKGNVSAVLNYSFTLDSVSPIATITSDLSNEPTSLDVTVSEVVSGEVFAQGSYSLKVVGGANDGQAIVINSLTKVSDTLVRLSLATPLTAGNYQLAIAPEVKDTAGNSLASLTLDFTATPPTLSFAPLNGEGMVSLTRDGVVRFGTKVKPETVTNEAFYLIANGQRLAGQVKVSSTNEFATFLTNEILPASTEVRMVVDGSKILSQNGVAIDANGDGLVGGIGTADFTTLPIVRIAGTDVWGYVYDSYNKNPDGTDKPLEGVEIRLDFLPDVKAVTDANGYFIIEDVPAPEFFVYIDGSKAANAPAGTQYASLGKAFHSVPGQSTQLTMDGSAFNIYLPPMAISDVKALSTTENTDVGFGDASKALLQKALPDVDPSVWDEVKVTFAPGSAQDREGNSATQAMIVPVAPDRLPAPLPPGVDPKLVISIQAGGANGFNQEAQGGSTTFDVPAPLQFPNLEGLQPGEKALFWSFDHTAGKWVVIGTGTVSEDGKVIKSDEGVGVLAPGWHFVNPGTPTKGPNKPPKPDECDPDVFTIENAIDLFEQVTKCTAGFFKIQGLIAKVFEIASEAKSLVGSADKLLKGLEDGSLNASDAQALFQGINSTKKILVSAFDEIKDQNPLGKALAISKCLEGLLGFAAGVCGKIVDQKNGCDTITVKTVCNGLDLAKSTLGKTNSLIEKAKEGLKDTLLALACGTIDQIASLLGFVAQGQAKTIESANFGLQAESDNLPTEKSDELKTLLSKLIGEMEGFLVNAEAGAEMGEILEDVGQQIGDLEPSVGQMAGELLDYPANAYYLIEYGNFASRGRTDANGQFDTILAPNTEFKLSIYDAQSDRIATYTGKTTASGFATEIPAIAYVTTEGIAKVYEQQGVEIPEDVINELSNEDLYGLIDSDNDGLVDEAENIIGTIANKKDTDNDGINDLAEIQQGLDPLGGQGFPTGIISSLPLLGEAKGVVVEGSTTNSQTQTAYLATGSYGLAVVNASQFNNPIILGQLDLAGDATDVAVDANLKIAAVATNNGGLQLVDVSDPMLLVLKQTININASQVEVVDGIAYATVGTSLRAVDLLSGEQIQQVTLPSSGTVTGLARDGSYLYGFISGPDIFFTVDISNSAAVTLKGQLTVSIASTDVGVFAGNGIASLAGSGLSTIDISDPANPTLISSSDNFFVARNVALNGSGLGLVSQEGLGVGLYSLSDPQNTNNFITSFDTSGFTYDVALASGIAYVADGTGGLQVINYLPFDNKGVAPTVTITSPVVDLDPNQTGIQITEGGSISIQANVTDDVQVRNVELLVNGQVVSNDLSFPFDLNAIALSNDPNAPVVNVQTRVTDTGGNTSLSNILTFDLVPDTIAPSIDSFSANMRTATIRFSEALDTTNITAANFTLINSSNQTIVPENIQFRDGDRTIQITYPALAVGNYQLVIDAAQLSDRAGNALGVEDVIKTFNVANTVVIDFESLRIDGASLTDVGSSYIEDNFTISKAIQDGYNLNSINSGDYRWNGSTSLFNNTINGTITLTQNGGGTFSLNSIDLDWLNGSGYGAVPVNFIGTKSDNSNINAHFDLDAANGFQTFNFTEFTDLISVSWIQESAYHQFDNIVVALQIGK